MQGLHLTADLRGCDPAAPAMHDLAALHALCLQVVRDAGLQAVGELFHRFPPPPGGGLPGITGVVLLAESHLAVHTWPELGAVTLDAYVCNLGEDNSAKAAALVEAMQAAFAPQQVQHQRLQRGQS